MGLQLTELPNLPHTHPYTLAPWATLSSWRMWASLDRAALSAYGGETMPSHLSGEALKEKGRPFGVIFMLIHYSLQ